MVSSFKEYSYSIKFIELIRDLIRSEMTKRHNVRFAEVVSFDRDAFTCFVQFVESSGVSVQVAMGAVQPGAAGQIVRVESFDGDWFLTDVLGGEAHFYVAP